MKNCITNENIRVVNTEMTENPSNRSAVNTNVAEKANTDIRQPFLNVIHSFCKKFISFSIFSAISEKAITPSVANALNHSDVSKTDVGLSTTISDTDITREVTASAFLIRLSDAQGGLGRFGEEAPNMTPPSLQIV